MAEFATSQIRNSNKRRTHEIGNNDHRSHELVVVVMKAQGLRNVLKMDKQSPFITIRIQDQEETTHVVSRGGQTPYFDDELWFNLNGVEDRTLHINVYHQKKNDAKLICCGEVDFTPAFKRSIKNGYDGWYDLYWEGREAGRVYLEITYYPKKGDVPIGTENVGRMQMSGKTILPANSKNGGFKNTPKEISSIRRQQDEELPELGSLNVRESSKSPSRLAKFEKGFRNSRSLSNSPTKHDNSFLDSGDPSTPPPSSGGGNWLSFLDNTIKLPSILNNINFSPNNNNGSNHNNKNGSPDINDELTARVTQKIESPELVKQRPTKLFNSDDEYDDDDSNDIISVTDKWKKSIASRQEPIYKESDRIVSSITFDDSTRNFTDDDDESEEEYTLGQAVDLNKSVRSNRNTAYSRSPSRVPQIRLDEDEMRQSYSGRKLPPLHNRNDSFSDSNSGSDTDDNMPPPPPKHIISMGSLFESVSSDSVNNFKLSSNNHLPKAGETLLDDSPSRQMSWYEKRKHERRKRN